MDTPSGNILSNIHHFIAITTSKRDFMKTRGVMSSSEVTPEMKFPLAVVGDPGVDFEISFEASPPLSWDDYRGLTK